MKYMLFNCIFQFSLWVLKCCYCIFTVKFWQHRCHFYCKFKKKFIRQESHTPHILATGVKQMSWKVLEYKAIFPPAGFRTPQPPTEESWERAIVLLPEEQQRTPPSSWECWKPLYDSRIWWPSRDGIYNMFICDASTGCSASVMYFLWLMCYVTFKSCYYWSMIYYKITAAGLPAPYRKATF